MPFQSTEPSYFLKRVTVFRDKIPTIPTDVYFENVERENPENRENRENRENQEDPMNQ